MGRRKREPPPAFATIRPTWDKNHYVMLFDDMLDSPAYIALSAHAKEAYVILRQEYKGRTQDQRSSARIAPSPKKA